MRPLVAHLRLELALLVRNGESLLLTLGIPVLLLAFFAKVDVLPIDGEPIDFLAPGVLALAVLSTSLVQTCDRHRLRAGVRRAEAARLDAPRPTPPARRQDGRRSSWSRSCRSSVLWVAGARAAAGTRRCRRSARGRRRARHHRLRRHSASAWPARCAALVTLAAANGLYLVLLLLSGMVIPLDELPGGVRAVARALPSGALAEAIRGALTAGVDIPGRAWLVLAVWAVAAPPPQPASSAGTLRIRRATFCWERRRHSL